MNSLSSPTHTFSPVPNFRRASFALSNKIGKIVHQMVLRHQHNKTVAALNMLSDHELEDIGLVRGNIKEAVKSSMR